MSIMQALQNNLDAKAKQYKDPALMHIFLMNNIHYREICPQIKAKDLLGDDVDSKASENCTTNANQYKRIAWSKVLQFLSGQGLTSSGGSGQVGSEGGNSSGASRAAVKERFRSFNVLFEEIYQKCGWSVPDTELRESLRLAVAEILLPAYRSFLKRFGLLIGVISAFLFETWLAVYEALLIILLIGHLDLYHDLLHLESAVEMIGLSSESKAPGKYVKHTPEQVEGQNGNIQTCTCGLWQTISHRKKNKTETGKPSSPDLAARDGFGEPAMVSCLCCPFKCLACGLCSCLCSILISLLVTVAVLALIFYFLFRPHMIGQRFGYAPLDPFYQSTEATTRLTPAFTGQQPIRGDVAAADLRSQQTDGKFNIDVKLNARLRVKVWAFKVPGPKCKVTCPLSVPAPATNSAQFQPTDCKVWF
ncbi:hypothetical protein GUJ93_ZPchr0458g22809 [Zizania palustris]|uniref:Exocyst subunit Exo70 family protein n=1 Tax=Zizania palustris TaxID=103762 RepID=A0A8J5R0W0_ZIZPA|nr:hypothetical protein GUJ93_ZPchr0458g22809 [Zizania palustris]